MTTGPPDTTSPLVPRHAFLLSVHRAGEPAVLENLRTRERARINDPSEIAGHVERWLEADDSHAEVDG